jgi:hypothetical protein
MDGMNEFTLLRHLHRTAWDLVIRTRQLSPETAFQMPKICVNLVSVATGKPVGCIESSRLAASDFARLISA